MNNLWFCISWFGRSKSCRSRSSRSKPSKSSLSVFQLRKFNFAFLQCVLLSVVQLSAGPAIAVSVEAKTTASSANEIPITLFHTNDLHSRILGYGPNVDYTPDSINDDATQGGVARLASLLKSRREAAERSSTVLTLDGGDIMMGTLFHTVSRETGTEFQLLKLMQYDAVTLGNHDFDFRPDGLGEALTAARNGAGLPPIVAANLVFDTHHSADDLLENLSQDNVIRPSMMIEKNGLKFGVIGVLGYHAISVIGEAQPLTFSDPVEAIRLQVQALKAENADVLVLLSHSGVYLKDGQWVGDDIDFAKAVPELDLIISGHSHMTTPEPLLINNKTWIVQAGSGGRYLGELALNWSREKQKLSLLHYELHPVDDSILGDESVQKLIDIARQQIDERVLSPLGLKFDQPLVEVSKPLGRAYDEHTLGNIAADALRMSAGADIAITSNGEVRDEIYPGKIGAQHVSDIFRIFPIGIGYQDQTPGYDLVKVYFTGPEIRNIMEILIFAYQAKGPSFYPRISGIEVHYNPNRVPLDRVTAIYIKKDNADPVELDLSSGDEELYSVTMTHYAFKFMGIINELSHGLLEAQPKTKNGNPVKDISEILVDTDPLKDGIQKQKAWSALMAHLLKMEDTDGNHIPNIQTEGAISRPRLIGVASYAPSDMLRNSTYITVLAFLTVLLCLLILATVISRVRKRVFPKASK